MRHSTAKRELIEPHAKDTRYVRRTAAGKFTGSQDDVSKSLSRDRRRKAKTVVKKGQGDQGDAKPRKSAVAKKKPSKARR
ncbi:MAG: hypothetical protein QM771_10290 [Nitrospira sp.]